MCEKCHIKLMKKSAVNKNNLFTKKKILLNQSDFFKEHSADDLKFIN